MDIQTLIITLIIAFVCLFLGIALIVSSIRSPGASSKSGQTKNRPGMEGEGCGCTLIVVGLFGLILAYFIFKG
ncbi:hypothetical protein QI041_03045 [Staphylococcus saprophyticus]|nr:hypothetical protein [Staphylococcus saprophyticus]MDW3925675.1 hypothetical protein [Staphylococcus saprophyticus]MDW4078295.1 hypothetical protein [Staphylococcus saprophyticus]MDW4327754.1 hypothetical protein [Staphylococcus saprophyticus]MDW4380497.1 hypothetical protein [Staphylococcus saprophyticus]